jgi:4-aminobutyrate aminotransferase/(S)-3-amino-2-methylpropionate transaminase
LGAFPRTDFAQLIKNSLGRVAPPGLSHVQTMLCGVIFLIRFILMTFHFLKTSANENAIKTAFIHYQTRKRGGKPPTSEDLSSSMIQELPGTPNLSVLGL